MKKVSYQKYGGVNELEITETPIPEITETTVLVKVKAVSINPLDWKILAGEMKLMSGSKFPKGIGIDFSGVVEAVGSSISRFKKGDAVLGSVDQFKGGALAEYVLVTEKDITIKPETISFEKAAAIPVVGFAALQIFNKVITVNKGTEVLINGATGGIGMFATQIAKTKGAILTAVVSEKGMDLAKKWGSDFVINYQKENILAGEKLYDVVIDLSGQIPFDKARAIMKARATYVNTIPGPKQIIESFLHNLFSKQKYKVLLSKPSVADLHTLVNNVNEGMDVVIAKTYRMDDFKEAYKEVPRGGILGKAVFILGE
ncbi:NAD(P)-dependent alcohol dehydrogenase [Dyadobacter sp. 3J3]|uniref:NAD(P)-dependent alcohol dehydrogenase n=1 Tax=Dyadobacter sp. 3J3 TaxID=2606600 RepID=UPI0013596A04|nr:NAD(P)-dependent alcohol dehydrogenase [Dyadobacter sp. 3J3]